MMLRLLLLLCFTAGHVLGETPKEVIARNITVLPTSVTSIKSTTQRVEADTSPSMIVSAESASDSLGVSENNTKLGEIPLHQSFTQTTAVTPIPSTVISPDTTTVLTDKHKPSADQFPHVTVQPAAPQTPITAKKISSQAAGKWIVNGTDKICVIVQMSVAFNVSYTNVNKTKSFKVFDMPVDNSTVKASGDCGKLDQYLTLQWSTKNITNVSMTMHFMKHESKNNYAFHHLDVVLPKINIPDAELNESMVLVHEAPNADIGLSNSYRCLKQQTLSLKQNSTNETAGYLTLTGLQFQAFKTDNSTVFGLAKDCAFDTPDVVPIAVGCALAGLVVIVLIAYLIGRRQNQSQGYSSM